MNEGGTMMISKKRRIYSYILGLAMSVLLGVANKSVDVDKNIKVKKLKLGKVTVDKLNVRAGPGESYTPVGILLLGDRVIIEEEISYPGVLAWLKVRAPKNARLFIAKQFVEKLSNNKGKVKEDKVNVRALPSLKATIVNQVNKGEEIIIKGEKGEFYEITPPRGTSLYVAKIFVDIIGDYIVDKKDVSKGRLVLSEQEWEKRFETVILKATEEHSKDISLRDYKTYIMELRELEKLAPNTELKSKATDRISALQGFQDFVESIRKKESEIEKKKLEDIIAQTDKSPVKGIPVFEDPHPVQEEYSYKATGYLEGVGLYFGRPAPYKLLNNKKVVCFLRSQKSLKKYLGKFVEVKGRNYKDSKGRNILELAEIKVLDDTF